MRRDAVREEYAVFIAPAPMSTPDQFTDGLTISRPELDNRVYATGDGLKGKAIYFQTGQWAGRIIRAELHELQHAELGRRHTEVDKTLLDPPPVVALRLFELSAMGQENEILTNEDIETIGLLCVAELVPVADISSSGSSSHEYESNHHMPNSSSPESLPVPGSEVPQLAADALVGTLIVRPHLIELDGRKNLLFVFSNLHVLSLGLFRLRYKLLDMPSATPGNPDTIIQAECTGGVFRVFSVEDFPGLQPLTNLTQILSTEIGLSLDIGARTQSDEDDKNVIL
ncbi:velvet factor-domain-containing protein [Lentinula edodes]|uniref:Velvet factor-domain-containing protein n=1 Tax=Lentinula lateritia TaxID=40482 RepID=A0A9W9ACL0_9AGAR|nr:velvet factor-domain-containing protein [Lentinula edodes]